jgi:hypothetical protein
MSQKLTPQQEYAASLLVSGETTWAIACKLNICRETISRWKQLPAFQEELHRLTEEAREETRYRLSRLVDASIDALWEELHHERHDSRPLQAALGILKLMTNERTPIPLKAPQNPSVIDMTPTDPARENNISNQ